MIAVIITADKKILDKLCDVLFDRVGNNEWDGYGLTKKECAALTNIQTQIEKQLEPEVCPLLLSLAEGKK
jgi:hypothetical protein